jgi:hypothetical protein
MDIPSSPVQHDLSPLIKSFNILHAALTKHLLYPYPLLQDLLSDLVDAGEGDGSLSGIIEASDGGREGEKFL